MQKDLFSVGTMTQSDRCIHTPGVFAKKNLLYVQEVGRLKSLTPHRCIREGVDSYLFLVVLSGKGCLNIADKQYEICEGDCSFIDCMEHYEHVSDKQDAWELAWVHFNGHTAKAFYELFMNCNSGSNIFHVEDVDGWNDLIGQLLVEQEERHLFAEVHCGGLLLQLMSLVLKSVADTFIIENECKKSVADDLRELLNEQYNQTNVMNIVKELYGEDLQALEEQFAKRFGITIEEYIDNRRFAVAKELLRFSIKPIDEIARDSGLTDVMVMQQMFREKEDMTAEEYRSKWAAWIR